VDDGEAIALLKWKPSAHQQKSMRCVRDDPRRPHGSRHTGSAARSRDLRQPDSIMAKISKRELGRGALHRVRGHAQGLAAMMASTCRATSKPSRFLNLSQGVTDFKIFNVSLRVVISQIAEIQTTFTRTTKKKRSHAFAPIADRQDKMLTSLWTAIEKTECWRPASYFYDRYPGEIGDGGIPFARNIKIAAKATKDLAAVLKRSQMWRRSPSDS